MKERVNGEIKEVSGSGSSNEGEGSNIEYLDVSGLEDIQLAQAIMMAGLLGKAGVIIAPTGAILAELGIEQLATISAIATIGDLEVMTLDGISKIKDVVDNFDSIPSLTKEQFYSLD